MTRTNQLTLADKATRGIAVATVAGLAALAARISYQHMLLLAERSNEYGLDAHAFPLTVDGLDRAESSFSSPTGAPAAAAAGCPGPS